jgi:lipoprotein-anchoring transpeptidase ErfK/SrfK
VPAAGAIEKDPRFALPRGEKRSLTVFLGTQTFEYAEDGKVIASGQVSTGSKEHPTPAGDYRVLSKDKDKRSGKYTNYFDQNTPMPYSLQFHGPYFVHEGWLPGYADSHGCIRLHYDEARFIYDRMGLGDRILVKRDGTARAANPWPDLFPVF